VEEDQAPGGTGEALAPGEGATVAEEGGSMRFLEREAGGEAEVVVKCQLSNV
jgi:hypothetical protein